MRNRFLSTALLFILAGLLHAIDDSTPADKAILVVRLPTTATLTIDEGYTVRQTGAERTLITPSLSAGETYRYTLKASWVEALRARSTTREVVVQAGKRVVVDFTKAEAPAIPEQAEKEPASRSRTFWFRYAATVTDLSPGATARIWLPIPPSNAEQDVKIESKVLPGKSQIGREPEYGNDILYVEAAAEKDGTIPLKITYRVTRREVRGEKADMTEDEVHIARFLQADSLVPIGGKSMDLIKNKKVPENQYAAARVFYDVVNGHMRYSKEGDGWGRGDADWACDSKYGNCTDFHSLFISLARARKIPAKFEIGFPLLPKRGSGDVPGYHCWAWFKPQSKGWIPVDISEANKAKDEKTTEYYFGNLNEDRVAFTVGRDINLAPKQEGKPLNFFIYPYVEVDGKTHTKVEKKFAYEDVK